MTECGKHGKPKSRLPTLPPPLGNPFGITTFPQLRRRLEYVSGPANPAENPQPEPLSPQGGFFLIAEPDSYVYTKGGTATVTITAQDYEKKPVPTMFHVELNRWDWRKGAGQSVTTTQGQTDASGKAQIKLTIPD